MTHLLSLLVALVVTTSAGAQFSNHSQVSIPVYLGSSGFASQTSSAYPIGEISGIALMLFENGEEEDKIMLTRLGDPILRIEKVGISSKVTFVFPDLEGLKELELLLSNGRLTVKFNMDEKQIARGVVAQERGRFIMRLDGQNEESGNLLKILDKVNNYLMRLHIREQKKVFIRPGFNQDTLNVIFGYDTQFDTDFDVTWLDENFYERLKQEASAAHFHLVAKDSLGGTYRQKVENRAVVEHTARLRSSDKNLQYGSILVLFEVMGNSDYYFLKRNGKYQIAIDYYFEAVSSTVNNLAIEKIVLRNVQSGDFVELSTLDLISSGIPILYVEFINSVIMDDYGTWSLVQVFTVLEDIFGLIDLPNEGQVIGG